MKVNLTPKRSVSNFTRPYIIAELGSNHNGDMDLAKKLILAAKKAGADCVKFQSWTPESIISKKIYEDNYFLKDDYRKRKDYTLKQTVEKFAISNKQLLEMKVFSDKVGIDISSSVFSRNEVDFLMEKVKAPFIKIASMDVNNYPFLEYVAKKKKPIIISTGLAELYELDKAIRVIEEAGNRDIVILHCVSYYPPKDDQVNLNNLDTLIKLYPYPIGFSDHTFGYSIPLAAVAKGACVIEKHFTLNKNMFGWDHKISANPEELSIICRESKRVAASLGSCRIVVEEDKERQTAFRRSMVAARELSRGHVMSEKDVNFKRPGSGIPPDVGAAAMGRKLKRSISYDEIIKWEDLQ